MWQYIASEVERAELLTTNRDFKVSMKHEWAETTAENNALDRSKA